MHTVGGRASGGPGCVPASACSKKTALNCERPALCRQTNSTCAIRATWQPVKALRVQGRYVVISRGYHTRFGAPSMAA